MGIEKKFDQLRLRVLACEKKSEEAVEISRKAVSIAEDSIAACERFREAVKELTKTATHNAEAIVEHISQLDSEKEEVVNEFRLELGEVLEKFNKEVDELNNRVEETKKNIEG